MIRDAKRQKVDFTKLPNGFAEENQISRRLSKVTVCSLSEKTIEVLPESATYLLPRLSSCPDRSGSHRSRRAYSSIWPMASS